MTPEDFARRRIGYCRWRTCGKCTKQASRVCPVNDYEWAGCDCGHYALRPNGNLTSVPLGVLRGLLEHINR